MKMGKKRSKLSLKVLHTLQDHTEKPMKPVDISSLLDMNQRSVRYALNILYDHDLVIKVPDMDDLRTSYYAINKSLPKEDYQEVLAEI